MKTTIKAVSILLALILVLGLISCGTAQEGGTSESSTSGSGTSAGDGALTADGTGSGPAHTIAVLVYDRTDEEVVAFKNYLVSYLGKEFNVHFIYSESVLTAEQAADYIREAADYGAEGVMSFVTYDLPGEVELCEELGIYYLVASGTVSDEVFAAVEDNPYFLGAIGPGSFIEYKAGSDMADYFLKEHADETEYFILSGGGCFGNEMHKQRTMGILDTLLSAYGVTADLTSEEIAESSEPVYIEEGSLKICVCPGYHILDEYLEMAQNEYKEHPYKAVLSVLPPTHMLEDIKGSDLAVVDCYSETNAILFADGGLDYLVGKYSSIIGPSFAAMANAVSGYAEDFRPNGKAFHITQGFWSSDSKEDFDEKYVYANSVEVNAYNYDDLLGVIREYNPDAAYEDLKTLAEAYTYEDAVARRTKEG